MALMTWTEENSVGVHALDTQHKQLFGIVNELHESMLHGQAQAQTGHLLRKLVDYTKTHFSAEEAMMQNAQYPSLAAHRVKHQNLVRQIQEFSRRHERGEVSVNLHLLNFLCDWLTHHVSKEDKEYGPWLNNHGVH
jgi:hemerythrin-like metal-binding protein